MRTSEQMRDRVAEKVASNEYQWVGAVFTNALVTLRHLASSKVEARPVCTDGGRRWSKYSSKVYWGSITCFLCSGYTPTKVDQWWNREIFFMGTLPFETSPNFTPLLQACCSQVCGLPLFFIETALQANFMILDTYCTLLHIVRKGVSGRLNQMRNQWHEVG